MTTKEVRVTRKRYLALLVSDALRWTNGPVVESRAYTEDHAIRERNRKERFVRNSWRGTPDTYVGSFVHITSTPYAWRPPPLNSDYPGTNAYGTDNDS